MKAILYAAKSTEDKKGSISAQLEDARAMAEREGWGVVGEFQDEGFSAYSGNRGPGLERARALAAEAAQEHGEAVLVAQHSDRFARGAGDGPDAAEHLVEVLTWANRHGVKLRTVQDDMFGDSRFALVMAAMMGQRNTEDSRRKGEGARRGHASRAARGEPNGGPPPFGYRRRDEGGLAIEPAEAEIARRIYGEYVAGKSMTAIARELHHDGVPTRKGGLWRQSTVRGILANPIYSGSIRHNGEVMAGVHEAIIDADTAARAAAQIAAAPTRRGRPTKGAHLFRGGLLRCQCGEAMIARTRDGYELYYCDGNAKFGREFCEMPAVRRVLIDEAVYSYFERVGLDVEATRATLTDSRDRQRAEARALQDEADRAVAELEVQRQRAERDYRAGDLTAKRYGPMVDSIEADHQAAQAEALQRAEAVKRVESDRTLADAEGDFLRLLAEVRKAVAGEVKNAEGVEAARAAITRLFERFTLHQGTPRLGRRHRDDPVPEGPKVRPLLDVRGDPEPRGSEEAPHPAPVTREKQASESGQESLTIEVWIREQAVEGLSDCLYPILRPEPLGQAGQKERNASPLRQLFDRIPVEGVPAN